MDILYLILLLLGAICFAVAAFSRRTLTSDNGGGSRGIDLLPLGLLFWILVPFLELLTNIND